MSDQVERGTVREMVRAIKFRAGVLEDLLKTPVVGGLEVRTDELAHVRMLQQQIDGLRRYLHLPSAEPEQKTGHWIDTDNYYQRWKCSECGCHTRDAEPNYCPNCGAKMERK